MSQPYGDPNDPYGSNQSGGQSRSGGQGPESDGYGQNPYGPPPAADPFGATQYGNPQFGSQSPPGMPGYGAPGYGTPDYGAPQYGAPQYGASQYGYGGFGGMKPDNNLVWAILATVLCCLPLGVVSIIKANAVDSLWAQGDAAGAQQAADEAKRWAIWSGVVAVALWIIIPLLWVLFALILAAGSAATY